MAHPGGELCRRWSPSDARVGCHGSAEHRGIDGPGQIMRKVFIGRRPSIGTMFLTKDEEAMLAGQEGEGARTAMELLVALGDIYEAKRLIPISSAHLSGVSYKTIGEGGIEFLESLSTNARVSVPTTLNPAGMDRQRWREMGISPRFADRQQHIIHCYERLGVQTDCSCTPYLGTNVPRRGQTLAWAESNALSFANSVVGARTNREGGPGALAAAIVGRTPEYGLHLDENRAPSMIVEVELDQVDYSLLGQSVGAAGGQPDPPIPRDLVPPSISSRASPRPWPPPARWHCSMSKGSPRRQVPLTSRMLERMHCGRW